MIKAYWEILPGWLQTTLIIILGPTIAVFAYRSWHTADVQANLVPLHDRITTLEKKHDTDILNLDNKTQLQMGYVHGQLQDIKSQNNQIYETLLRR